MVRDFAVQLLLISLIVSAAIGGALGGIPETVYQQRKLMLLVAFANFLYLPFWPGVQFHFADRWLAAIDAFLAKQQQQSLPLPTSVSSGSSGGSGANANSSAQQRKLEQAVLVAVCFPLRCLLRWFSFSSAGSSLHVSRDSLTSGAGVGVHAHRNSDLSGGALSLSLAADKLGMVDHASAEADARAV